MKDTSSRPIPESYWVEPDRFLAGEYPGGPDDDRTRLRIDALIEAGFDTFIDLTRSDEILPYERILREESNLYEVESTYQRFPIGDFGLPSPERMNSILDSIEKSLQMGRNVYLHCWGGIGRTGTTVGCYLVRKGMTGEEALDQLSIWWRDVPKSRYHPHTPETLQQMEFVRTWAKYDEKSRSSFR